MTLAVPARQLWGLQEFITMRHLENMNKIILVTGSMVGYAYMMEFFTAWYSGSMYETFAFLNRAGGWYAWSYWIMVSCNVLVPQIFWSRRMRQNIAVMFVVSLLVNVGMWFERFVIIISSLAQSYMPTSWGYYRPTWVDMGMLIGSFGLFMTLFLLFCRYLPIIALSEVKHVMPEANPHAHGPGHGGSRRHGGCPPGVQWRGSRWQPTREPAD